MFRFIYSFIMVGSRPREETTGKPNKSRKRRETQGRKRKNEDIQKSRKLFK